jgi:cysteinyl-tRNA synthetase
VEKLAGLEQRKSQGTGLSEKEQLLVKEAEAFKAKYEAAMEDDFNTADAVSAVFELVKFSNTTADENSSREYIIYLKKTIETLCQVLGILTERKKETLDEEVEALIEARQKARKEKNFSLADQIRQQLLDMGIVLEDTREGVKWKRL